MFELLIASMAMCWRKDAIDRARAKLSGVTIAEENRVGYWEEWVSHRRAVLLYSCGRVSHVLYCVWGLPLLARANVHQRVD